MKTVSGLTALVLIGWCTSPVFAQVQPPQDRINTAIARARQVGIPVALLESKIAEGKAKGVSMDRIAGVVERREAALEQASQAMSKQPDVDTSDLSVAADAVESGVSEAVLTAVAESAPRERRAVAIAALTQLVELGDVPEAALGRVRDALKRGPDALANLPAAAGAGRRGGSPQAPSAAGGRGGATPGPPASVPAPGGSPRSGKPDGAGTPATPGGRGQPPATPRGGGAPGPSAGQAGR